MEAAAELLDRMRQAFEIFERMKARLVRKDQALAGVAARKRRGGDPAHRVEADPAAGFEFFLQKLGIVAFAEEQIAVAAGEIAVDRFEADDLFDAVDGGGLAPIKGSCVVLAAQRAEFV